MKSRAQGLAALPQRAVVGVLIFVLILLGGIQIARAADVEIVPSVGITRAVDGDNTVKVSGGLAVRGYLTSFLGTEVGVSYRSEDRFNDRLRLRTWPVTVSLLVAPVPVVYGSAGVGWYHTTFDYDQEKIAVPISDETKESFGVHVGGGVKVPFGSAAALDLSGRYVMMQPQESRLVPEKFDPDFWTTSLGLAFRF